MAKRYVELPQRKPRTQAAASPDGAAAAAPAVPPAPADDAVGVVYQVDRIAVDLADALPAGTSLPRALVLVQGKAARQVFLSIAETGIITIMPLTGDWRLDANPKMAMETVALGRMPNRALFTNAYAVLEAARECGAQAIFLGKVSQDLSNDNRFLLRAADAGLRVFMPFEMDATRRGWIECEPDREDAAPQPTRWRTCHRCKLTFDDAEFAAEGYACPSCKTLARLDSDERIGLILDEGTFEEWDAQLPDADPLGFPGYPEKIADHRERSGKHEAVRTGRGTIGGHPAAVGFMEPGFFIGSMGSTVGEKVARLFDRATEAGLPVVLFCASGGARMQEGLASLMQMAKTACAVERHDRAGLLYVSVLTDPTTGGVTASFATLGDIILAEPKTLIGFAGQRVIRDTIKQELPEGFQTAEFALNHGLIDAIVKRPRLRGALIEILALHQPMALHRTSSAAPQAASAAVDTRTEAAARSILGELFQNPLERFPFASRLAKKPEGDGAGYGDEPASVSDRDKRKLERHAKREMKRSGLSGEAEPGSAWESVQLARNVHRPTTLAYIRGITETFFELHGDRSFADDAAIVGGIGTIGGLPVTIIGQEKGSDLNDRIRRNFGCPQPEGYRKSARLMRQAEKFGRPIVCLVDTQGAFCGTEAEERGQGNAIAENLALMASLHVPVVSVLLGEGGSGGALALALSNCVAMQEHAVYSVLSPEGFASILWKDGKRAPEAAEVMGMNAAQVLKLGVVDDILSEGLGAAHENPEEAIGNVRAYIEEALDRLAPLGPEELRAQRQQRFARF